MNSMKAAPAVAQSGSAQAGSAQATMSSAEAHAEAERMLGPLRGAMRSVVQSFGGTEGYMRWVRGEDEAV